MQVGDILVWLCNLDTDCYFQPRFCRGKQFTLLLLATKKWTKYLKLHFCKMSDIR